jgi:hypothetical protein
MPKTPRRPSVPPTATDRIAEAQNAIQAAADAIRGTLDGIERDLDVRRAELRELRARPLPRDEAVVTLDRVLAELTGGPEFGAAALLDGDARHLTVRLAQAGGASIVAKLFTDDLRTALMAELDQAAEQRGGWPTDSGEDRAREVDVCRSKSWSWKPRSTGRSSRPAGAGFRCRTTKATPTFSRPTCRRRHLPARRNRETKPASSTGRRAAAASR